MLPNSRENSPVSSQCRKTFMSFMWVCFFAVISRRTISQSSWVLPSCSLDSSSADHCVCVYIIIFTDWLTDLLTYLQFRHYPKSSPSLSCLSMSTPALSSPAISLLLYECWTYRLLISRPNDCLITFVIIGLVSSGSEQSLNNVIALMTSLLHANDNRYRIC